MTIDHDPDRCAYEDARANDYEREVARDQLIRIAEIKERLQEAARSAIRDLASVDCWLIGVPNESDIEYVADGFADIVLEIFGDTIQTERLVEIERDAQ